MKYIIYTLFFVIISSCSENFKNTHIIEKYEIVNNGDSIVWHEFNGQKEGKCTEYSNERIKIRSCFYKQGQLDSLYIEYYKTGEVKFMALYNKGIQEGRQVALNKRGYVTKILFIEDDSLKIKEIDNSPIIDSVQYVRSFFKIINDTLYPIGNLYYDTLMDVIPSLSNYYVLLNEPNEIIVTVHLNKLSLFKFKFFPEDTASICYVCLGELNSNYKLINSNSKKNYLDSNNIFEYKYRPSKLGWHKIRGVFYEENDTFDKTREIPIYYNYYVN